MEQFENLQPLLEAIVSYIDEGVILSDTDGNVIYQNRAAGELLGMPPDRQMTSLGDIEAFDIKSSLDKALLNANGSPHALGDPENLVSFEQKIAVNGCQRHIHFDGCLACENKGFRLLIFRDRTKQKKLESLLDRTRGDLITSDPSMLEIIDRLHQVAPSRASVLLQGESGTGKTHIARILHKMSDRADKAFVEVNCAAIPETLIESELFGHVKGAFTGATQSRPGRFLSANQGTIFLDEVGEIPLHLQAKLLRVIQDGEFEAVGSDQTRTVDVRIISSSNRKLREMVDDGEFRADLYYRLAVIPLYVPAIRERPGDIPLLLEYFCRNLTERGYPSGIDCSPEAMRMMMDYPWPGNVRELENAVEHAVICSVDKKVLPESLPQDVRNHARQIGGARSEGGLSGRDRKRQQIVEALERAAGNKTLAAKYLGVDRTTLWRHMRKLNVSDSYFELD